MSLSNGLPLPLRPAPSSGLANSLPTLIARINAERGGFRNITEESLRQEIVEAEAAGEDVGQNESSSEEDEPEEKPDRQKEVLAARDEILGQAEHAALLPPPPPYIICGC